MKVALCDLHVERLSQRRPLRGGRRPDRCWSCPGVSCPCVRRAVATPVRRRSRRSTPPQLANGGWKRVAISNVSRAAWALYSILVSRRVVEMVQNWIEYPCRGIVSRGLVARSSRWTLRGDDGRSRTRFEKVAFVMRVVIRRLRELARSEICSENGSGSGRSACRSRRSSATAPERRIAFGSTPWQPLRCHDGAVANRDACRKRQFCPVPFGCSSRDDELDVVDSPCREVGAAPLRSHTSRGLAARVEAVRVHDERRSCSCFVPVAQAGVARR